MYWVRQVHGSGPRFACHGIERPICDSKCVMLTSCALTGQLPQETRKHGSTLPKNTPHCILLFHWVKCVSNEAGKKPT